jgi:hypothetical protein
MLHVDKIISILLLVAKKNPIEIEFFMANDDIGNSFWELMHASAYR